MHEVDGYIFSSPDGPENPSKPTVIVLATVFLLDTSLRSSSNHVALTTIIHSRTSYLPEMGFFSSVLARVMVVNIACNELLRKLVPDRKTVGELICCGLGWVCWPPQTAGKIAVHVVPWMAEKSL